jgi:hypothetical protein
MQAFDLVRLGDLMQGWERRSAARDAEIEVIARELAGRRPLGRSALI